MTLGRVYPHRYDDCPRCHSNDVDVTVLDTTTQPAQAHPLCHHCAGVEIAAKAVAGEGHAPLRVILAPANEQAAA